MDNIIDFDELCERLGTAYVKFLCALNDLEEEHDEVLSGGINHADCKNHFLSNAYLSMFNKFELNKPWIYHSKAAKEQIDKKEKGEWNRGLCFEHIVPKQQYLQSKCEKLVKEKGKDALQEVTELIKKYWKIAVITSAENKRLLTRTMPKGWKEGDDLFARYNNPKDCGEKIQLFDFNNNLVNK